LSASALFERKPPTSFAIYSSSLIHWLGSRNFVSVFFKKY
jgi:hypothetical protein